MEPARLMTGLRVFRRARLEFVNNIITDVRTLGLPFLLRSTLEAI